MRKSSSLKPHCHTCDKKLQRVQRGIIVKNFLFWLPIKKYRCFTCNTETHILYIAPENPVYSRRRLEARDNIKILNPYLSKQSTA